MANNSRSEATDPSTQGGVLAPAPDTQQYQPTLPTYRAPYPVHPPQYPTKTIEVPYNYNQPTTTTISTGPTGLGDFLPSLVPAIQSGSYVLVVIAGFILWRSRGLLQNFLEKHMALVENVKVSLDKQIDTNNVQMDILKQLSNNNTKLIDVIESSDCISHRVKSGLSTLDNPK